MVLPSGSPTSVLPPKAEWQQHTREPPQTNPRREPEGTSDEGSIGSHTDSAAAAPPASAFYDQAEKVVESVERVTTLQAKSQALIRQLERDSREDMPPPPPAGPPPAAAPPVSQTTHRKKAETPTANATAAQRRAQFARTATDAKGSLVGYRSKSSEQGQRSSSGPASVVSEDSFRDDVSGISGGSSGRRGFSGSARPRPPPGAPSLSSSSGKLGKKPITPPSSRRATPTSGRDSSRSKGFERALESAGLPTGLPAGMKERERDTSGQQSLPASSRKTSTPTGSRRGVPSGMARKPMTPTASSAALAKNMALAISTLNQQPEKSALKRSNSQRSLDRRTVGICDEHGEVSIPGVPLASSASLSGIHSMYSGGAGLSSERSNLSVGSAGSSGTAQHLPNPRPAAAHARITSESPILPPEEYAGVAEAIEQLAVHPRPQRPAAAPPTPAATADPKMLESILVEHLATLAHDSQTGDEQRLAAASVADVVTRSLELSVTYYTRVVTTLMKYHAREDSQESVRRDAVEDALSRLHATLPAEEAVQALATFLAANVGGVATTLLQILFKILADLLDNLKALSKPLETTLSGIKQLLLQCLNSSNASLRKRVVLVFVSMYKSFGPAASLPFFDVLQINQVKLCHVYLKRSPGFEDVDLLFEVTEYRANNDSVSVVDIP